MLLSSIDFFELVKQLIDDEKIISEICRYMSDNEIDFTKNFYDAVFCVLKFPVNDINKLDKRYGYAKDEIKRCFQKVKIVRQVFDNYIENALDTMNCKNLRMEIIHILWIKHSSNALREQFTTYEFSNSNRKLVLEVLFNEYYRITRGEVPQFQESNIIGILNSLLKHDFSNEGFPDYEKKWLDQFNSARGRDRIDDEFSPRICFVARSIYLTDGHNVPWTKAGVNQKNYILKSELSYMKLTMEDKYSEILFLAVLLTSSPHISGLEILSVLFGREGGVDTVTLDMDIVTYFIHLERDAIRKLLLLSTMSFSLITKFDTLGSEGLGRKLAYWWLIMNYVVPPRNIQSKADNLVTPCINVVELARRVNEHDGTNMDDMFRFFATSLGLEGIVQKMDRLVGYFKKKETCDPKILTDEIYFLNNFPIGLTPLHWTTYFGDVDVFEYIISHETHPSNGYHLSSARVSASAGEAVRIDGLFDRKWTPLMWACVMGRSNIVKKVVECYPSSPVVDECIVDLLSLVALSNDLTSFKYLHDFARTHERPLQESDRVTPLHYLACRKNLIFFSREDKITHLFDGALLLYINIIYKNFTPLDVAVYNGFLEFVQLYNNDISRSQIWKTKIFHIENLGDIETTLLFLAARRGHEMIVDCMLNVVTPPDNYDKYLKLTYEMLSDEKDLQPAVVWKLVTFKDADKYHLSEYRRLILDNLKMTSLRDIYEKHVKTESSILRELLQSEIYLGPNQYRILQTKPKSVLSKLAQHMDAFLNKYLRGLFYTTYEASKYTFNLPHSASLWFIRDLIMNIDRNVDPGVFSSEFVKVSIQCAWESYGLSIHLGETAMYVGFMVFFGIYNYEFNDLSYAVKRGMTIGIIFYSSALFVYLAIKMMIIFRTNTNTFRHYLTHYHSWTEVLSFVLTVTACSIRFQYNLEETHHSSHVIAFATLFVYTKIMHILSPFESTGPLIGMIETIIWGIRYYLIILFVVVTTFALSLYIISNPDDNGDFGNRSGGLLNAYNNLFGSSSFDPNGVNNLSVANSIAVILVLLTSLILVNLLISIMSDLYTSVSKVKENEWRRKVCRTLIMQPHWRNAKTVETFEYIQRDIDRRNVPAAMTPTDDHEVRFEYDKPKPKNDPEVD